MDDGDAVYPTQRPTADQVKGNWDS